MTYLLTFLLTYLLTFLLIYLLAAEVRRCPLHSGAPRVWPGAAQSARDLPGEARCCPLQSRARCWGPALPTAIWRSMLKSGEDEERKKGGEQGEGGEEEGRGVGGRRTRSRRIAQIKSNNPHLTGGEIYQIIYQINRQKIYQRIIRKNMRRNVKRNKKISKPIPEEISKYIFEKISENKLF